MAEEKGWKLLVVCIGAEAEALAEGEALLRDVLGVGDGEDLEMPHGIDGEDGAVAEGEPRGQGKEDRRVINGHGSEQGDGIIEETDDDEPGPELLLSTQEDELGREVKKTASQIVGPEAQNLHANARLLATSNIRMNEHVWLA
ncbi:MAG: hypothetical protein Q9196_004898 [Gyalolechia fulgens]